MTSHADIPKSERKKFQPGEYIVTDTGGGARVGRVVEDWWTTRAEDVRVDFVEGGSRLDVRADWARLASQTEVDRALSRASSTQTGDA